MIPRDHLPPPALRSFAWLNRLWKINMKLFDGQVNIWAGDDHRAGDDPLTAYV
jgi:hypothetical protein